MPQRMHVPCQAGPALLRLFLTPSLCPAPGSFQHLYAAASTIHEPSRRGRFMDIAYLSLAVAFWLLMAGMAVGCARLGGPTQ